MTQFSGMSDTQLERLRGQLALDPSPQAKIQLEQVIAEKRRRNQGISR
jgi:hypothetical protein